MGRVHPVMRGWGCILGAWMIFTGSICGCVALGRPVQAGMGQCGAARVPASWPRYAHTSGQRAVLGKMQRAARLCACVCHVAHTESAELLHSRIPRIQLGLSLVLTRPRPDQVRSLPIRKDDEVQIVRGKFAKEPAGKVTSVYRRRFCIYIDRIVKQKDNGSQVRRNPTHFGHWHTTSGCRKNKAATLMLMLMLRSITPGSRPHRGLQRPDRQVEARQGQEVAPRAQEGETGLLQD